MVFKVPKKILDEETHERAEAERRAQKDSVFRHKVALQQFMNHNAPLFRAFAHKGIKAQDLMKSEVLNNLVGNAVRLATLTAAHVLNTPVEEIKAADARPFRYSAAEWVAAHWANGKKIDIEESARQIAEAAKMADKQWDYDPYKDEAATSRETSIAITTSIVASHLFECVSNYDFRMGKTKVFETMIEAVLIETEENVKTILPEGANEDEIRNLRQTIVNNLASLMEACYEQKAREVLKAIRGKPETFKMDYLSKTKPIEAIKRNFQEWSTCIASMSLISAKRLNNVKTAAVVEGTLPSPSE